MNRYTVIIVFKTEMFENPMEVKQSFKTLKELNGVKSMIDDSVSSAIVFDNAKQIIIEKWK